VELLERSLRAAGTDTARIRNRYKRIQELEPGGSILAEATRYLAEKAQRGLAYGGGTPLVIASEIFEMLGDAPSRLLAEQRRGRETRRVAALLATITLAFTLAYDPAWLPLAPLPSWLRLSFATLGGTFWGLAGNVERPAIRWTRAPVGFVVGRLAGTLVLWLAQSFLWASIVAVVLALGFALVLTENASARPSFDEPPAEEALVPPDSSRVWLAGVLAAIESVLRSWRLRLRR
jgi:hypothetical protein